MEWIALLTVPNVGPIRFVSLVKKFGTPKSALSASVKDLRQVEDVGEITASDIKTKVDWKEAEKQVKLAEKNRIGWITFLDSDYPDNLKQIYDFPPFFFMQGNLSDKDDMAVAIVGTRTASTYGKSITEKISSELTSKGFTIVSGLALGIDTYGHQAALNSGGRTVAVFGSGLDVIYPTENKRLVEKIVENGAVISEFLMGTKPEKENFPTRNRIISGLSLGVIVVEAGAKSGALLTAQYALDQNKEVFAIPGNLTSKTSEGTNALIKQGAKLVTSVNDILSELKVYSSSSAEKAKPIPELPAEEKSIYQILSTEPAHIDQIAQTVSVSTGQALSLLLSLELKGLVKQLSGKMFTRA
ncbi:MAG: DNA protecting protein DprA [candidate division Zixibacteria bacterium RBG_16_40_9]|nr:MAG: DNA protecting protein DprA [candidate division Zixibacteria bacterium RBG_16_40_9]